MEHETILNVCPQDLSVTQWTRFTRFLLYGFYQLTGEPMRLFLLGGLFVISFLIISGLLMRGLILLERGRRIKKLWLWGFPIALFLSLSPLLIGEPLLTTFVPTYEGQTADAVVVLGRGSWLYNDRLMKAADLIQSEAAPRVFVSGSNDAPMMAMLLAKLGVEATKISGENCSKTTEENAEYTAEQLIPTGVRSIILISDPAHMLRSQLVFQSFGFQVIPYSSPLPHGLGLRYRRLITMRESLGLVSYGLMGRYWPRSIISTETTAAQKAPLRKLPMNHIRPVN
ncbi:MAG: YdcF family protein [Cyanobacteria bacterium P01_D01_bin.156]